MLLWSNGSLVVNKHDYLALQFPTEVYYPCYVACTCTCNSQ